MFFKVSFVTMIPHALFLTFDPLPNRCLALQWRPKLRVENA